MDRISALDRLRGLAIMNMIVGHSVATFTGLYVPELWYGQLPPDRPLGAMVVRMINHTGTPAFFLIMGISMALLIASRRQNWPEWRISAFFGYRGLLLIAAQFTIINAAWALSEGSMPWSEVTLAALFDPRGRWLYFGVLFALGSSMVIAAILRTVSSQMLSVLAIAILLSPLFYLPMVNLEGGAVVESFILGPLAIPGQWHGAWILYTVIPWCGMTLLGMVVGRILIADTARFVRLSPLAGALLLTIAVALKLAEGALTDGSMSSQLLWLQRYPPEPTLLFYSLGFNAIIFGMLSRVRLGLLDSLLTLLGRNALSLYLVHLFVLAGLASIWGHENSLGDALAISVLAGLVLAALCKFNLSVLRPLSRRLMTRAQGFLSVRIAD